MDIIEIYSILYKCLLFLRRDLANFLGKTLPLIYTDNWWKEAVLYPLQGIKLCAIKYEHEKIENYDISLLFQILKYNWHGICNIGKDDCQKHYFVNSDKLYGWNINNIEKVNHLQDCIRYCNEKNIIQEKFVQYLQLCFRFSKIIDASDGTKEYISNLICEYKKGELNNSAQNIKNINDGNENSI